MLDEDLGVGEALFFIFYILPRLVCNHARLCQTDTNDPGHAKLVVVLLWMLMSGPWSFISRHMSIPWAGFIVIGSNGDKVGKCIPLPILCWTEAGVGIVVGWVTGAGWWCAGCDIMTMTSAGWDIVAVTGAGCESVAVIGAGCDNVAVIGAGCESVAVTGAGCDIMDVTGTCCGCAGSKSNCGRCWTYGCRGGCCMTIDYRRAISRCRAVCHDGPVTAGRCDNCGSWGCHR